MSRPVLPRDHLRRAFTLIELLVVVAIIALLISILLPSLSKARAQARTTLCHSRISQMAKAILIYADDYDETPPFTSKVGKDNPWEACQSDPPNMETWLGSLEDMTKAVDMSYNQPGPYPADEVTIPRSGTLFKYLRFEKLYRCPEFERRPALEQNLFNYPRSVWARKYRPAGSEPDVDVRISVTLGSTTYELGDLSGPILKPSGVFAPAAMPMFEDEQWNRHIAGGWGNGQTDAWVVFDPVFDALDELGQYHGSKIPVREGLLRSIIPEIQQGSLAFYDGHVDMRRDPCPSKDDWQRPAGLEMLEYFSLFQELAYAQQGLPLQALLGQ